MLTFLIRTPEIPTSNPTDTPSNTVGLSLPDNVLTYHGNPGSYVTYLSKRFGDIKLCLIEPTEKEEHILFAHHIWNSGVQLAEFISNAGDGQEGKKDSKWSVVGETVLELGAGTGIVGITAALAGAGGVILSDYPSQKILSNLRSNVQGNVPEHLRKEGKVVVQGHEWGILTDEFSTAHAHHFSRILCADCLWMDDVHYGLAQSIVHFLSYKEESEAWVLAGFHTGRAKLVSFFDVAVLAGLEIKEVWERDADGYERAWEREREDIEKNRWLVVAILRRNRSFREATESDRQQRYWASVLTQKSNRHI